MYMYSQCTCTCTVSVHVHVQYVIKQFIPGIISLQTEVPIGESFINYNYLFN